LDNAALKRLRLGFVLLGALLLLPLGFVLRAAEARLEAQRRLRHEIVAERIFDEMEHELGSLLANEQRRPSSAYDAENTRVSSWSPFVVGYFAGGRGGTRLLAADQLGSARAERVAGALRALWRSDQAPELARHSAPPMLQRQADAENRLSTEPALGSPPAPQQEDVLRLLNRAKRKAPRQLRSDPSQADPLMGL
jgi:hypothetical protein